MSAELPKMGVKYMRADASAWGGFAACREGDVGAFPVISLAESQEAARLAMESAAKVCDAEVERLKDHAKKTPLLENMCHTLMVEALACAKAIRAIANESEERHG